VRAEDRTDNGRFDCNHDSRHCDQEELDHKENVDCFDRGIAGCEEEDDREEGGSITFSFRVGLAFANSLVGVREANL
jgi:hypothetical protein